MDAEAQITLHMSDLVDPPSRGFDPFLRGFDTIFVVRRDDKVFAYVDLCPHYGRTRLSWRKNAYLNADKSHISCSAHGALFQIDTGECVMGACLGQALTPLQVTVAPDGRITIPVRREMTRGHYAARSATGGISGPDSTEITQAQAL